MSALVEEAQRQRREKPTKMITTKPATAEPRSVLEHINHSDICTTPVVV